MINLSILISSSEVIGPGGLFDINATLPLVAIQFLLLMLTLNIILYNPLLTVMEERKKYILTNLSEASKILAEVNKLTTQYEQELDSYRTKSKSQITNIQKMTKGIFQMEVAISQTYIDSLLDNVTTDLLIKKNTVLNNVDEIIQSLCDNIETRLAI